MCDLVTPIFQESAGMTLACSLHWSSSSILESEQKQKSSEIQGDKEGASFGRRTGRQSKQLNAVRLTLMKSCRTRAARSSIPL